MNKIFTLAICAFMVVTTGFAQSDVDYKELAKQRKEMSKYSKKELNERATKDARKEAKKLAKEGWKIAPGAISIEKQLDRSYIMQYELDEDVNPKYIMSEGMAVGGNYDGAKMQALELAKVNLAGQIQTEIEGLIQNTVANQQLSEGDAVSVTKSVAATKNRISQRLGRVQPIVEVYRDTKTGKEVLVRLAYSFGSAKVIVKEAVRKDLEEQGEELHNELDKILGL